MTPALPLLPETDRSIDGASAASNAIFPAGCPQAYGTLLGCFAEGIEIHGIAFMAEGARGSGLWQLQIGADPHHSVTLRRGTALSDSGRSIAGRPVLPFTV